MRLFLPQRPRLDLFIPLHGTDQDSLEVRVLFSPNYRQDFDNALQSLVDHPKWSVHYFTQDRILEFGHHSS